MVAIRSRSKGQGSGRWNVRGPGVAVGLVITAAGLIFPQLGIYGLYSFAVIPPAPPQVFFNGAMILVPPAYPGDFPTWTVSPTVTVGPYGTLDAPATVSIGFYLGNGVGSVPQSDPIIINWGDGSPTVNAQSGCWPSNPTLPQYFCPWYHTYASHGYFTISATDTNTGTAFVPVTIEVAVPPLSANLGISSGPAGTTGNLSSSIQDALYPWGQQWVYLTFPVNGSKPVGLQMAYCSNDNFGVNNYPTYPAAPCTFAVPNVAPGNYNVLVMVGNCNLDSTGAASPPVQPLCASAPFTVTGSQPKGPSIVLGPASGSVGQNVQVGLANFGAAAATVTFNGQRVTTCSFTSGGLPLPCSFTVPDLGAGTYTVTASNVGQNGLVAHTASATFTITNGVVTITSQSSTTSSTSTTFSSTTFSTSSMTTTTSTTSSSSCSNSNEYCGASDNHSGASYGINLTVLFGIAVTMVALFASRGKETRTG
jgi:hypothetical protein